MSEYVITTDNNSDLPEKYLKDHGVGCMYLSYSMDGKNYTHGNFLFCAIMHIFYIFFFLLSEY